MAKKRIRKHKIEVYLDATEKEKLESNMSKLGISNRSLYAREMLLNGIIINLDISPMKELITLMRNATNNINQVAKRANQTCSVHESDVTVLAKEYETLNIVLQRSYSETLKLAREVRAMKL